jgi:transposase-like protein
LTVNHDLHFVDPDSNCHINGVENFWRKSKHEIKMLHGIKRGYIQSYLNEFLWRQNNLDDPFSLLLKSIKAVFPLSNKRKYK